MTGSELLGPTRRAGHAGNGTMSLIEEPGGVIPWRCRIAQIVEDPMGSLETNRQSPLPILSHDGKCGGRTPHGNASVDAGVVVTESYD
jgi:hypothetical protein